MNENKKTTAEKKRPLDDDSPDNKGAIYIPNKRLKTDDIQTPSALYVDDWKFGIQNASNFIRKLLKDPTPDDLIAYAKTVIDWKYEFQYTRNGSNPLTVLECLSAISKVDDTWNDAFDAIMNNLLDFCDHDKHQLSGIVDRENEFCGDTALETATRKNNYVMLHGLARLVNGKSTMNALNIAAKLGHVTSVETLLRRSDPQHIDLQHFTMNYAIQGAFLTKNTKPILLFTLCKYPLFFDEKSATTMLFRTAKQQKIDKDDVLVQGIRAAMNAGSEILVRYINTAKRHCSSTIYNFIPDLLNIMFDYAQLNTDT